MRRIALVAACAAAVAYASVLDGLDMNRAGPAAGASSGHGPATAGKPAGDGSSKLASKIAAGLHKLEQKIAPTPIPAPGLFERIAHAFARHEKESPPSLWDRIFASAEPPPQPSGIAAMASRLGELLSGRGVPEDTAHAHGHLGHPHANAEAKAHGHGAGLHVSVPTFGVPTLWSNAMAALRTGWLVATFFIRLGWSVLGGMISRGWAVSAWVLDVLVALVVWDAFRTTVWGPSAGKSLLARLSRIVTRSLAIVWGRGQDAATEALRAPGSTQGGARGMVLRWGRLGLVLFVAAPVLVTAVLFVMLPAALFALAIKNAVPAAVAMTVFAFVHALTVPPFSYLVNASFVEFLIVAWRIAASIVFVVRAQRAAIAVKEHGAELKAYAKGATTATAAVPAAGAGGIDAGAGFAGGQPAAAAGGGGYIASGPLEGLVERNILLGDAIAARVEGAVDSVASRLMGRGKTVAGYSGQPQQAQQQQAQQQQLQAQQQGGYIQSGIQPEDDVATGSAVGTQPGQAALPRMGSAVKGRSAARAASPIYEEEEQEQEDADEASGAPVRSRQGQARRRYAGRQQVQ